MAEPREPHWSDIVRSTDFYRDILVTILGVLIALGIGEIAQDADRKRRAEAAREAIDAELSRNAATFVERTLIQPCLDRRLDDLEAILREARQTGRIAAVGTYGATPYRTLETAAWDEALGSGTTSYLGDNERKGLASVYPTIARFNEFVMLEQELWWRMRLLADSAGPADPVLLTELGSTLKQLSYRVKMNGILAAQLKLFTEEGGLAPNLSIFGEQATPQSLAEAVEKRAICQPLQRPGNAPRPS